MTVVGPWPLHPIGERLKSGVKDDIPITFMFGANTWIKNIYGPIIKESRQNSYTKVHIVPNSGHHIYTDQPEEFHKLVLEACKVLRTLTN